MPSLSTASLRGLRQKHADENVLTKLRSALKTSSFRAIRGYQLYTHGTPEHLHDIQIGVFHRGVVLEGSNTFDDHHMCS